MKTHILFLWLLCAGRSLGHGLLRVERHEVHVEDVPAGDETTQVVDTLTRDRRSVTSDDDDNHSADSGETEVVLDKDGNPRDKRTLGFIVRGLASALGYTIGPLQVASLPNPTPAPPPSPAPPAAPPKAPPSAAPPTKAPTQLRQRETIRITGLVNFSPNANSNLPAQLGQYEQLFHGSAVGAVPAPAPAQPPAPAPAPAPVPKPKLQKIPNPIVSNLSPLLPASRPPSSIPGLIKQEIETEYRNNENVDNYNVENKEIKGDKNLYLELPGSAHLQIPDWRQGYSEKLRILEERQKEYADRLAKHEALLAKHKQDYEDTNERFANREKEIAERDRAHAARLREQQQERDSQKEEKESETDDEDSRKKYASSEDYKKPSNFEHDEDQLKKYELEEERTPKQYSDYEEEPKKYEDYEDTPRKTSGYFSEGGPELPISKDKEIPELENLRNSYGESLEDQGEIDENIADYFVKFKDTKTGLYVPEKTQNPENYNKEKQPWWKGSQENFESRLEHLKQEYSFPDPESKYEEYQLEEQPEEKSKSAEKVESNNEADETTPDSNNAQRVPDYSEAFGGYEPYVEKEERKHDRKITPPSTDTAESPRSKLNQNSNEESEKESEKSEDEKDIPFYNFDFKSFVPYHSPVKYIYDSEDAEPGISQIQSYNRDSEGPESKESTQENSPVERKEPNEEHQPITALPQKLAIQNLHDGEAKDLQAWPAPFDYVFDSTEQTNIAELPRIQTPSGTEVPVEDSVDDPYPGEGLQAAPVAYLVPDYDTAFRNQHGIQQQRTDPAGSHGHLVRAQNIQERPKNYELYEYSRPSSTPKDTSRKFEQPHVPTDRYTSQESNRQTKEHDRSARNRIKEQHTHQQPELQNQRYTGSEYPFANTLRNIQTPSSPSTRENNHYRSPQQYQPVESQYNTEISNGGARILHNGPPRQFGPKNADLRNRGNDFNQRYTPAEPRFSGRRFDETPNRQLENQVQSHIPKPEDKSSLKFEDPKSAHDFFGFSQNDYDFENNKQIDKSHDGQNTPSVSPHDEALDLLVVSEPTPYHYDEKLTEFTDGPESDTEKVKVKEYRNKQATVTVSETKQLSPEGPVHLIGYTRRY